MLTSQKTIKDVIDFVLKHASYYSDINRDDLEHYAEIHARYGTILVLHDIKGISAVARWNVLPSRDTLHIIDVVIRPDLRSVNMLKYLAIQIWKNNLQVRFFYYERYKHAERKSYGYELTHWLKLKENSRHERINR